MPRTFTDGDIFPITSTDPAAGVNIVYTATQDMVVRSLVFTFVTDGTAANRGVIVSADDGTNTFFKAPANFVQTATLTMVYCASAGGSNTANVSGITGIILPADGLKLRKNDRIVINALNGVAGDNFSAAVLQAELPD